MNDLRTLLMKEEKQELHFMAGCMGLRVGVSYPKKVMVERIRDFMLTSPAAWLEGLLEIDLRMLEKGLEAGKEQWLPFPNVTFMSTLENLHAIEISEDEYGEPIYAVVPEIYDAIGGVLGDIIKKKEENGSFMIDKIALGITNVYGTIPLMKFFSALEKVFKAVNGRSVTIEDTRKSILMMSISEEENGNVYFCTPYFHYRSEILAMRKQYKYNGSAYAPIDVAKVLASAENLPFCAYGADTPEGRAVLEVMRTIGLNREQALEELHYIWLYSQFPMNSDSTEMMFSAIDEVLDHVGHFDEYESFVNTIAAYANSVPKWLLRGHTANEANLLKVTIASEERDAEGEAPADGESAFIDFLHKSLPRPESATDVSKYGISIKRVGLSDPCPCGSGLTYGRCHGKHIN